MNSGDALFYYHAKNINKKKKKSCACGCVMIVVVKQHPSFELLTMLHSIDFSNCHNTLVGGRHCAVVRYNRRSDSQGMRPSQTFLWHR